MAIRSDEGYTLQQLGQYYGLLSEEQQKNIVNQWIAKFRPSMTVIGGIPAYASTNGLGLWAGQKE
ncbi:MAG: hypothetical protein JRJ48_05755 [Deltaproteobacteria bacterium]|nr:hypothetical protein [Deltaproteobacteria bacterium]